MSPPRTLLLTGAGGFVGRVVAAHALEAGWAVRGVVRQDNPGLRASLPGLEVLPLGDLTAKPDWARAFHGVDAVVHLAARVHVMAETESNPEEAFRRANVEVTALMAQAAMRAGVGTIVFVSTIKVNGERTGTQPFRASDPPAPADAYGRSKWQAEESLRNWARTGGGRAVVLRPPLVYGPGVRGNLRRLMGLLAHGVPLPLGGLANRRSLIGVHNLADAILAGAGSAALPGTYLVAEPTPVDTSTLLRMLGKALGRPARLFSCPDSLLRLGGALVGMSEEISRLTESLEVDVSAAEAGLGWRPRLSLEAGLGEMASAFGRPKPY